MQRRRFPMLAVFAELHDASMAACPATTAEVPDSRYGWLPHANGPCIVKAMDPQLVAYNKTLLDHERMMRARLRALGKRRPN